MTSTQKLRLTMTKLSVAVSLAICATAPARAQDPRIGLRMGWKDAGVAAKNMELVGTIGKATGFYDEKALGSILLANSDLAFRGNIVFQGNFTGFQIIDVSNIREPKLKVAVMCPGGQGDLSVYGNLLFMSVEMPNGRTDCGSAPMPGISSPDRFKGVRIFDIRDLEHPKQIAAVQTCRGSHTHTLVTDPNDRANIYVYVSGTSGSRPVAELAGCSGGAPDADPNTALFRIDVIKVPLASPQEAKIVSSPRIFANAQTGAIAGLWQGGAHGAGTQSTSETNQCHDITAYPAIGLAAGACSGNGILLDIRDPVNPVRVAEVMDPNFAYWHSATFNNDGSKVIFTDEWGGGTSARCRSSDPMLWGADAIFNLSADRKLTPAGYYKLPVAQTDEENCVAHNGSLLPVPGRDIMIQAWYQGGISVFDFTDAAHPVEIAYFDRGPMTPMLTLGGAWGAYWYNGNIYSSEIGRGLDIFRMTASAFLTQNEIDAANLIRWTEHNPQHQTRIVWPAEFVVGKALIDQIARSTTLPDAIGPRDIQDLMKEVVRVEKLEKSRQKEALNILIAGVGMARGMVTNEADVRRFRMLEDNLKEIAAKK